MKFLFLLSEEIEMTTGEHSYKDILKVIKETDNGLPYISVGSGMGHLEDYLCKNGINVICVDPTLTTKDRYTKVKMVRKPDFSLVSVLMEQCPELVGNCNIMLIYPLPDYVLVDYLSIVDFQPILIVTVVDDGGQSGSFYYHKFLRKCGLSTQGKLLTSENFRSVTGIPDSFLPFPIHRYDLVYSIKKGCGREMWFSILKRDCKKLDNITHYSKMLCNKEDIVCMGKKSVEKQVNISLGILSKFFKTQKDNQYFDCCRKVGREVCICGVQDVKKICNRCKKKYYCSKKCQVLDWKFHKKICFTQ